jgi:hypothetical protein
VVKAEGFYDFTNPYLFEIYPEEINKKIKVTKSESPLNQRNNQREKAPIEKDIKELDEKFQEAITAVGYNKFSLGTGIVDVTFQVRNGVRYALEDTFSGYAEFQRRKVLEEVLNANAKANATTIEFLLLSTGLKKESFGLFQFEEYVDVFEDYFAFPDSSIFSSSPIWDDSRGHDLLQVSKNIINKPLIKDLNKAIAGIVATVLVLLFGTKVIMRTGSINASFSHVVAEPLIKTIRSLALILGSYFLMTSCFDSVYFINNGLHSYIADAGIDLANLVNITNLNNSWQDLANNVGYFPTLALSVVSIFAQIFTYIYITGLLLQVIFGFIVSPLWAFASGIESIEAAGISSLLTWLKALLTLNFIPVIYLCFALINSELNDLNIATLNIAFSIAALLLLPIVSKLLIGEGGSVMRSAFYGYELLLSNIESSYSQIRKLLEEQYQLQINTSNRLLSPIAVTLEQPIKLEPYSLEELIPHNQEKIALNSVYALPNTAGDR